MNKLILTLLVAATSLAAFAQGKISIVNDSSHLLYFGNSLKSGDAALAGQPLTFAATPSGATFLVDIFGGATAGSMTLQTTATINPGSPGIFGPFGFVSPNLPGGATATMQVKVRESGFATAELAEAGGGYWGYSQIFTFAPSSSIAFNTLVNHGGTALSTWTDGTVAVPGGFGAVMIPGLIPEPSSLALTGLGISALLLRRKR